MTHPSHSASVPRLEVIAGNPGRARRPVTVVIPTYCEREQVPAVLRRLWEVVSDVDVDVWVVDDRSPDGTGEVVGELCAHHERLSLLAPSVRNGRGGALAAAMERWLAEEGAPGADRDTGLFVEMDGDGSHDPGVIPELLAAAKTHDLVLGSRYVLGGRAELSPHRKVLSRSANAFARLILGLPYRDCSTGYRCYRHGALARVQPATLTTGGHATHLEVLYRLSRAGMRIGEVPIYYAPRAGGTSKVAAIEIARVLLELSRMRLRGSD